MSKLAELQHGAASAGTCASSGTSPKARTALDALFDAMAEMGITDEEGDTRSARRPAQEHRSQPLSAVFSSGRSASGHMSQAPVSGSSRMTSPGARVKEPTKLPWHRNRLPRGCYQGFIPCDYVSSVEGHDVLVKSRRQVQQQRGTAESQALLKDNIGGDGANSKKLSMRGHYSKKRNSPRKAPPQREAGSVHSLFLSRDSIDQAVSTLLAGQNSDNLHRRAAALVLAADSATHRYALACCSQTFLRDRNTRATAISRLLHIDTRFWQWADAGRNTGQAARDAAALRAPAASVHTGRRFGRDRQDTSRTAFTPEKGG